MGNRFVVAFALLASAQARAATFDTAAKVAASRGADSGKLYSCVVVDSSHIQCAYDAGGGVMHWCAVRDLMNPGGGQPGGYTTAGTAGDPGGLYLVQDHPDPLGADGVLVLTAYNTNTNKNQYEIMRLSVTDPASALDCLYWLDSQPAPYINCQAHPDLPPRMALAGATDAVGTVYAMAVVPSSDYCSQGDVLIASLGAQGGGTPLSWFYTSPHHGVFDGNYKADPDSPVTGGRSSLTGGPLFAIRDNTSFGTTTPAALYLGSTGWYHLQLGQALSSGGNNPDMAQGIALGRVPVQVVNGVRYGDALFAIDTNGNLQETRFHCTDNLGACNGGYGLGYPTHAGEAHDHGNGGAAYDTATDSLTASWTVTHTVMQTYYWATAFARVGTTAEDFVRTDIVNGYGPYFDTGVIPGTSGWVVGTDLFYGQHVTVVYDSPGSSEDWVFGACRDNNGNTLLCEDAHPWLGLSTFDWGLY